MHGSNQTPIGAVGQTFQRFTSASKLSVEASVSQMRRIVSRSSRNDTGLGQVDVVALDLSI
jgi:hypothetical protein